MSNRRQFNEVELGHTGLSDSDEVPARRRRRRRDEDDYEPDDASLYRTDSKLSTDSTFTDQGTDATHEAEPESVYEPSMWGCFHQSTRESRFMRSKTDFRGLSEEEVKRIKTEREREKIRKKQERKKIEAMKIKNEEEKRQTRPKNFFFQVDGIIATFESKLDNAFIEVVVGGLTREVQSTVAIKKKVTKKVKDKDGNETEKVEETTEYQKKLQILTEPAARFFTRYKAGIKAKEPVSYQKHHFKGLWSGTYEQLHQESLEILVWHKRWNGPNELIGRSQQVLVDIAKSKIEREFVIHTQHGSRGRNEIAVVVNLKCVFQETFDFHIEFHDWEFDLKAHLQTDDSDDVEAKKPVREVSNDKHVLHFTIPSAREGTFTRAHNALRYCMWNSEAECFLKAKGGHSTTRSSLKYHGTRSWLEDEAMVITLYKRDGMCNTVFAKKEVNLQGVLDHGYIMANLDKASESSQGCGCCFACLTCIDFCASPEMVKSKGDADFFTSKLLVKGVVSAKEQPLYRQQGNVGRPTGPNKFFQLAKNDTYMVVKIIRAKGLQSLDEYKEQLNPSVTVEWAGVRKVTRVIDGNTEPFWDEDIYFKIPDMLDEHPRAIEDFGPVARASNLVLSVWDNDTLSVSPLGYSEIDFDTLYQLRDEHRLQDPNKNGKTVRRWVYKGRAALKPPSERVDAKDFLYEGEVSKDEASTQYLEFFVFFDNAERAIEQPVISKALQVEKKKENPYNIKQFDTRDPTPVFGSKILKAQAFWDETLSNIPKVFEVMLDERGMNRTTYKRFFAFLGKDEFSGGIHFLPTFVKPIHPPNEIQKPHKLLYFMYCIEFDERASGDRTIVNRRKTRKADSIPNVWVWSDPFFFLEKKRGDFKDHALLLCNFLLGLGFNAWVCIGNVRQKGRHKKSVPHVWVMTIEKEFDEKDDVVDKRIRFWEPSVGQTFVLVDTPGRFDTTGRPKSKVAAATPAEEKPVELKPVEEEPVPSHSRRGSQSSLYSEDGSDLDSVGAYSDHPEPEKNLEDDIMDFVTNDSADVKPTPIPDASVQGASRTSRIKMERQKLNHQRNILDPLKIPQLEAMYNENDPTVPYATLDIVFNHKKLYANLQDPNPEKISYDFLSPNRWAPFPKNNWKEFIFTKNITPFYPEKTLQSLEASSLDVLRVQEEILNRIINTIRSHREFACHADTEFFNEFQFANQGSKNAEEYISERLEFEEFHGDYDEELVTSLGGHHEGDEKKQEDEPVDVNEERRVWMEPILASLDQKSQYMEKIMLFKHADGNRISDRIVEMCKEMLEVPPEYEPMYGVGVKIERLPSMVTPSRVFVFVTYTPTDGVDV